MGWDTVDSIDVTLDGQTHVLTIERTASYASEGADGEATAGSSAIDGDASAEEAQADTEAKDAGSDEEEVTTTYRLDGEDALPVLTENFLDTLNALDAEGQTTEEPVESEPELTFTFHRSTPTFSEVTLAFTRYDNSFYLVTLNGEGKLLVNKNDVAELKELFAGLTGVDDEDESVGEGESAKTDEGAASSNSEATTSSQDTDTAGNG